MANQYITASDNRLVPTFSEGRRIELDNEKNLSGDFYINYTVKGSVDDDEFLSGQSENVDTIILDRTSGSVRLFAYVGSSIGARLVSVATAAADLDISVSVVGDIATLTVNGASSTSSGWLELDGNQSVKYYGKRGASYSTHVGYDIDLSGDFWALDEEFDDYQNITSSLGSKAKSHYFTPSDVGYLNARDNIADVVTTSWTEIESSKIPAQF